MRYFVFILLCFLGRGAFATNLFCSEGCNLGDDGCSGLLIGFSGNVATSINAHFPAQDSNYGSDIYTIVNQSAQGTWPLGTYVGVRRFDHKYLVISLIGAYVEGGGGHPHGSMAKNANVSESNYRGTLTEVAEPLPSSLGFTSKVMKCRAVP